MKHIRSGIILAGVIMVAALNGCAGARLGVEPWERDLLASEAMRIDTNPAHDGNDAHIYFSKEASQGGSGFGGGGCGCN